MTLTAEQVAEGRILFEAARKQLSYVEPLTARSVCVGSGLAATDHLLAWLGNHADSLLSAAQRVAELEAENARLKSEQQSFTSMLAEANVRHIRSDRRK